jgi:hypothetical protein
VANGYVDLVKAIMVSDRWLDPAPAKPSAGKRTSKRLTKTFITQSVRSYGINRFPALTGNRLFVPQTLDMSTNKKTPSFFARGGVDSLVWLRERLLQFSTGPRDWLGIGKVPEVKVTRVGHVRSMIAAGYFASRVFECYGRLGLLDCLWFMAQMEAPRYDEYEHL